ncbi:ABC-three component system protein [Flavobacterium sp. ZS1P14]|uniref:ABC-three component system protein n=1 Tax=Flavobacterium sp. ZS1P14 TaxID=3401729 RepID=UPI003AB1062E
MSLINPNDIHSAADTWSGFIYQGKVALYHVLTLILNEANVDELELQLDSLEDFAIVRNDGTNIVPVSLHQVKAMKSHLYSSYQEAFAKLEKRKLEFPCERDAFFHLAINNERSKAAIEAAHPTLIIYEYDGDPFCRIEDLQNKADSKVQSCLLKFGLVAESGNPDYVSMISEVLEEIITSQIIAVHAANHVKNGLTISEGAYYFTIPLKNFIAELTADVNTRIFDKNYYRRVLRNDLNLYFQEYCMDIESEVDQAMKTKLSSYLTYFNSLNDSDFEKFLQNIMPHKIVKFSKLQEYKDNTLQIDEFKNALIFTLREIRDSDKDLINKLGWICPNNKRYFPSTINISDTAASKKRISEQIIGVALDQLIDTPYNSDYIITEGCQVESLENEAVNIFKVGDENYDNITKWRKLSLINLEQAKINLNGINN